MFLPTGLTFIVHLIVVGVRKIAGLFGFVSIKKPFILAPRLRLFLSASIIVLIAVYVGYVCVFFVAKGLNDSRATWKMIDRGTQPAQPALAKEPILKR